MENEFFEQRTDLSQLNAAVEQIKGSIGKIIVGQQETIDLLIAGILADGHLLIEGVPGIAKTLTAKLIAKSIDAKFSRIQFTPDLMPSDVLGTSVFNPKTVEFDFKRGPIFGNIVLIDEINRAPAKTQSALFEVMEERQITIDGGDGNRCLAVGKGPADQRRSPQRCPHPRARATAVRPRADRDPGCRSADRSQRKLV